MRCTCHRVRCSWTSRAASEPADAAYRELHRVLRSGGRAVLTCWETTDTEAESLPQRLRDLDLRGGLSEAGFADVTLVERPEWLERELALWAEAADLDPSDDPALQSLHDEALRVLTHPDAQRRVIASATRA